MASLAKMVTTDGNDALKNNALFPKSTSTEPWKILSDADRLETPQKPGLRVAHNHAAHPEFRADRD